MPKADTRYLYKRNGRLTWWIKIRVPGTDGTFCQSLKTKDLREAQARRDKLLAQREQLVEKTSYASQLNRLRKEYLASVSAQDREIIKEKIQESADDMVMEMGLKELYWGANEFNPDHMSEEQLKPWKAYKTAIGELTPLNEVVPHWLETIENKRTRADYRRGVEVLQNGWQGSLPRQHLRRTALAVLEIRVRLSACVGKRIGGQSRCRQVDRIL